MQYPFLCFLKIINQRRSYRERGVFVSLFMFVCLFMCMYVYLFVCMFVCVCVFVYVRACMFVYLRMYDCLYVCVCISLYPLVYIRVIVKPSITSIISYQQTKRSLRCSSLSLSFVLLDFFLSKKLKIICTKKKKKIIYTDQSTT